MTDVTAARSVPVMTTSFPPWRGPDAGLSPEIVGAATKVNTSNAPVTSVPPAEVTVTSTGPAGAAGATAVIEVSAVMVKLAAGTPPKLTAVAAGEAGAGDDDRGPTGGRALRHRDAGDARGGREAVGASRRKAELPES